MGGQLSHLRLLFREFEALFLGALKKRTFEQRTMRYRKRTEMMEEARPSILEKARRMGRDSKTVYSAARRDLLDYVLPEDYSAVFSHGG